MPARLWMAALPQCERQHADFGTEGGLEMDLRIQCLNLLVSPLLPSHHSPAERDRTYSVHPAKASELKDTKFILLML